MSDRSIFLLYLVLTGLLIGLAIASLSIGYAALTVPDVVAGLTGLGSATERAIVVDIRLPRVLMACLVGMSLGMSGAALQGLLRNPLAEPGLLGISSSASLGAVTTLYFGLTVINLWILPVSAMTFALFATLALYGLTMLGASNLTLILAGIALSSLTAALTSLALNLAPNPADVQDMVMWLMGSVSDRSYRDVQLCLPFVALGLVLLSLTAGALDLLALGEAEASSLGVNVNRLRGLIILGTALSVGSCVAVTGTIGFVGLVVPHILRRFVKFRPGRLLWASALGGAVLVLAADIALRLIDTRQELMLGVVTALIGSPFFLGMVLRAQRQTL